MQELIKVRGFQVSPSELEAVLLQHPKIEDAGVIGVPATKSLDGELPRAYIVRRPDVKLENDEVKRYMAERLAKYKTLDGGVLFVDVLPKTASGKKLKRVLREQAKREMAMETRAKL